MDRVDVAFAGHMGGPIDPVETIQCHHNDTVRETHAGEQVWVSRKGAIDAHEGVDGLIPGSMGTASYVVRGKGNALALHSSPHGAGREHSRLPVVVRRVQQIFHRPLAAHPRRPHRRLLVDHTLLDRCHADHRPPFAAPTSRNLPDRPGIA